MADSDSHSARGHNPSGWCRRRWLRRTVTVLATLFVGLLIAGFGISWGIDYFCEAHPPKLEQFPPIVRASLETTAPFEGGCRRLGDNYLRRENGILRMYLSGEPFTLGYCNAALSQPYLEEQERSLIATIREFVPSKVALWLLTKLVVVRNRSLPSYVAPDQQMEIYGLACAYKDPFPEIGPIYHRFLNYHAAHDISHVVMDNPLLGCTSFAAWGTATRDGHLLAARNFDFNAGRCFDANKIVYRVKPDRGLGYISVAWPGMIGVVTGINDARIAVMVNACYTKLPKSTGTPVALMLREVMQYASSLEEAVDIISRTQVSVADAYLVADGKTEQALIVEKTPDRTGVRRPEEGEDRIIDSNHFLAPEMMDLPGNREYMREGTTVPRFERMQRLVQERHGALIPEACAAILRDREAPGGVRAGWGNPAAICCLIATHSVIVDVTAGIIWVSAGPHQLGAFVPFGLDDFEHPNGAPAIPADPMLSDGSYDRYAASQECLHQTKKLMRQHHVEEGEMQLVKAHELNPDSYLPAYLLGRAAFEHEAFAESKEWLDLAASHYPAYESERKDIQDLLGRIERERKDGTP